MCGEKLLRSAVRSSSTGSPPRVRGKAVHHKHRHSPGRITPAYAGKRIKLRKRHSICGDHPRVCGEKISEVFRSIAVWGSPPRVRGKERWADENLPDRGITPACAGKSFVVYLTPLAHRDHPRVCGEKNFSCIHNRREKGSPPRVRGKAVPTGPLWFCLGITPACAGKSWSRRAESRKKRDHPRVCGEKARLGRFWLSAWGSPPRVRGKVSAGKILLHDGGITPACAGKSSIQHLTASLGEFEVQKGHPVPHLRQRLQVWPDHARHLRHGLILHASRSAGQGRRLCPGPCPDTAGSGTPRGPSPAKRPHTSPPAATPGGCRAWQSGATAPGSQ